MTQGAESQFPRARLLNLLVGSSSEDELRTLCFVLDVDYEVLGGEGKAGKARELLLHLEHRDDISELIEAGKRLRPDIDWDALIGGEPTPNTQGRVRVVGQQPQDVVDYFKDRDKEVATISRLLADPTTRLVSIIGQGGMGKTALACKVLGELERERWPHIRGDAGAPELPNGIVYASTRTTGISLERLFLDCARLLGGEQQRRLHEVWTGGQFEAGEKVSRLLEMLRAGKYILLLDNMDDLLDDGGQIVGRDLRLFVEQCLTSSRGVCLLVTTRITLAVRREALRFGRRVDLVEGLPAADAAALLRELDPEGDCGLRDASEGQLAKAVSMTHGVPRALEVLASLLASDSLARMDEMVGRFYEEKDVVNDLVEENYKRLDGEARRVIEALAVFRRPVSLPAVAYLLEPFCPKVDVSRTIGRLMRTRMVSADREAGTVTLHPIDQDYAYSLLLEGDSDESSYTRQALERRAADYYVQLRTLPETWQTIDDLEPQLIEFEHRVRAGDYDDAYQVVEPIGHDYLFRWGYHSRTIALREKLCERLEAPARMLNLNELGLAYSSMGRTQRAIEFFEEALGIAQAVHDLLWEGGIAGNLSYNYYFLGQVEKARECFERALSIARVAGDQTAEGLWLGGLATIHSDRGQTGSAIELYNKALTILRKAGARRWEGDTLGSLGRLYDELGQSDRATELYNEALSIARETDFREHEGGWLGELGIICCRSGRVEKAIELFTQSLDILRTIGDRRQEIMLLGYLGQAHQEIGYIRRATDLYERALSMSCQHGYRKEECILRGHLGVVHRWLGQTESAIEYHSKALALAREIRRSLEEATQLDSLGRVYQGLGKTFQALDLYSQALEIAARSGYRREEGAYRTHQGYAYYSLGQYERSMVQLNKALSILREISYHREESDCLVAQSPVLLTRGDVPAAQACCQEALSLNATLSNYEAMLILGIVFLHQSDSDAKEKFRDSGSHCQDLLDRTPDLYGARYALATALVGLAASHSPWAKETTRAKLLAPALAEYHRALDNCSAKGVVQDAIRDLELIRDAGIEGLEPVFELLESALEDEAG